MLRGGPRVSAQDNKQQQQQKQKKRLSFREPEIEGPQRFPFYGGCRSKTFIQSAAAKGTSPKKSSSSLEDLSLEDQALQIARSVGNAFSDLSFQDSKQSNYFDSPTSNSGTNVAEQETAITGDGDYAHYQRSCQLRSFKISAEDREYLDAVSPPLGDSTMRCPPDEAGELSSPRNCIPPNEPEERYSSSAQHQVQLLKYQLDQQCQQTQMALHQVQLLTDQMEAENAARRKAQEQNNQLMNQNKDLLDHMEKLFQQIEDLERQVHMLEQERRSKIPQLQEPQVMQLRPAAPYASTRRLSGDQTSHERTTQNRSQYAGSRKSPTTASKSLVPQIKGGTTQTQTPTTSIRRSSMISQRALSSQNKNADTSNKAKETLQIGDTSPPIQSGASSPFSAGWKLKTSEVNSQATVNQTTADKNVPRSRTGSFSSFSKTKPPEGNNSTKSTLFGSSSSLSNTTNVTNKKYSSSTSDLYTSTNSFQVNKPLMIEESSVSAKSSISSLNVNPTSKLPRYQPYTGWQRRSSLTTDSDPISGIGKETFKSAPETSLFNR